MFTAIIVYFVVVRDLKAYSVKLLAFCAPT